LIRTYKYRLYPNRLQRESLDKLLEIHRTVYNDALTERRLAWERCHTSVNYYVQANQLRATRAEDGDLAFANYSSLQHTMRRLDHSFSAFFRRIKTGETPGYPRYRSRKRFDSFEYTYGDGCKLRLEQRTRFYVQNVGELRIKYHRPALGTIKHVVLKRSLGKWYACLQWEAADTVAPGHEGPAVGIDLGLHHLVALSDETFVENPRWLRESLADLRVAQRRLARRKRGSNRRRKAAVQVARRYEHVSGQRRDFWHKATAELAKTYGLIAMEDLPLAFMTHNRSLALSTHDAGLGMFKAMMTYKAEYAGTLLVLVNPRHTSQVCSGCGSLVDKDLSVREHVCPDCGLILDRDVNAARNILELARTGPTGPKVSGCATPVLRSSPL
jgi:putative transposase